MVNGVEAFKSGSVTTNDSVRLHYFEAGTGAPLVLLHGWSQAAEEFKHQLKGLSDRYRVIALDLRGHGMSEKPAHGYKISRLAKDLDDALQELELDGVTLLGHSMGCSVIWSYLELFGTKRLSKLILVDEPAIVAINPAWSKEELEAAGACFPQLSVVEMASTLAGSGGEATVRNILGGMFTSAVDPSLKEWVIQCCLKMPTRCSGALLYNHAHQDWRDVIPRITLPTLVVAGRTSLVPWKGQEWIHKQINGSRFEIFEEAEGGQHFMFLENPERFNRIVAEFIG